MTMTIEFLRARLLSERSASKAAKQKVQQLGKKVRTDQVFLLVKFFAESVASSDYFEK